MEIITYKVLYDSLNNVLDQTRRKFWIRTATVLVALMLIGAGNMNAADITATSPGGDWTDPDTWVGGVVPTESDNCIIPDGSTVTIDIDPMEGLTIGGYLDIKTGGTLQTKSVPLIFKGDLIISGTLTGLSEVEIAGPSDQSIAGFTTLSEVRMSKTAGTATFTGNVAGNNLVVAGSGGTLNLGNSLTHSFLGTIGSLMITSGTLNGGSSTLSTHGLTLNGGTFINGSRTNITGNVILSSGIFTAGNNTEFYLSGNWTNNGVAFDAGTSRVYLNGGAQIIDGTEPTTFFSLGISGTGIKTFSTVPIVNNILGILGDASSAVSVPPIYGSTAILEYFTTHTSGPEWITPFTAAGGVIINRDAIDQVITLDSPKELGASVPLTIMTGAELNTANFPLTFGGNFINNGTLTANASPVAIAGDMPAQSIAGFTTTGPVLMTKTGGTATFTGNVSGLALTIGGGGVLNLGSDLIHVFTGDVALINGGLDGGSSALHVNSAWTGVGSNFMPNTGTVLFDGANQAINTPTTFNNVSFSGSGTKTINANTIVNQAMTIGSGVLLNVAPTIGLTIDPTKGSFTNSGTFTLQSDATGTATLLCNSIISGTGSSKVQQYLSFGTAGTPNFYRFWYVSSPVDGATSDVFNDGDLTKFQTWSFNEASQPNPYTLVDNEYPVTFAGMKGYVVRLAGERTVTFSGVLNTGEGTLPLSNNGDPEFGGYNLVGNPYPSYLNWDDMATTEIPGIWYRSYDAANKQMVFDTYNGLSKISVTPSGHASSNLIPPMQAFWVWTAGAASLNFSNSMRSHNVVPGNILRSTSSTDQQIIRLRVSNGENADEAVVAFDKNASDGFDAYDSPKMSNGNANIPEIFTYADSRQLTINDLKPLETTRKLALGFRTGTAGTFTINAKEILNIEKGTTVVLKDKLTNVEQDLTLTPEYTFTSDVANNSDRFCLIIGKTAANVLPLNSGQNFEVVVNNDGMISVYLPGIKTSGAVISICDIQGQQILRTSATGEITSVNPKLSSGTYIVVVSSNEFKGVKKITIKE